GTSLSALLPGQNLCPYNRLTVLRQSAGGRCAFGANFDDFRFRHIAEVSVRKSVRSVERPKVRLRRSAKYVSDEEARSGMTAGYTMPYLGGATTVLVDPSGAA